MQNWWHRSHNQQRITRESGMSVNANNLLGLSTDGRQAIVPALWRHGRSGSVSPD